MNNIKLFNNNLNNLTHSRRQLTYPSKLFSKFNLIILLEIFTTNLENLNMGVNFDVRKIYRNV